MKLGPLLAMVPSFQYISNTFAAGAHLHEAVARVVGMSDVQAQVARRGRLRPDVLRHLLQDLAHGR